MSSYREFNIFAQRGAFSSPYNDLLHSTQIGYLHSIKIQIIFLRITEPKLAVFAKQGDRQIPNLGRGYIIVLRPGDMLVILPGAFVVYALLILDDCLIAGRMYQDNRCLISIIQNIAQTLRYLETTNKGLPQQLKVFLEYTKRTVKRISADRLKEFRLARRQIQESLPYVYKRAYSLASCTCKQSLSRCVVICPYSYTIP